MVSGGGVVAGFGLSGGLNGKASRLLYKRKSAFFVAVGFLETAVAKVSSKPVAKRPQHPWVEKDPNALTEDVKRSLDQAMALEKTPIGEKADLLWIMAQESQGIVDVRNPHSSARGLFQLTRALYNLNPRGEASFGNAVEECQGGIRYVLQTYGSAAQAKTFWKAHKWY